MGLPKFILHRLETPSGLLSRLWAWLFNKSNDRENEAAVRALELDGDESVLDLGFGGGASFPHLLAALPDGDIVGVEPTDEMIERARKKWADEIAAGRLDLRSGSASDLGLSDDSVDAALTVNTVYFWRDLAAGFAELKRALVPGGRLVVSVVDPDTLRQLGFEKVDHRTQPADFYAEQLDAAGFVDVGVEPLDFDKPCSLVTARAPG